MTDDELKAKVLATLGMSDASKSEQDEALYRVESIAQKRLALALPELLSDEQLAYVESMRSSGQSPEAISQWIEGQLPDYDKMIRAIIQDVAEEAAPPS